MKTNRIIQADCVQATADMPAESVDLTVFSPPYDGIRDYQKGWTFDYHTLGKNLFRITKNGGMCAVVMNDGTKNFAKSLTSFKLVLAWCAQGEGLAHTKPSQPQPAGAWRLFETCIYQRHGNPGGWWKTRFRVDHEFIFLFLKGPRPKTFHKEPLMVKSLHAGKEYSGTDRLTSGGVKKIARKVVNALKCRGTIWQYATSNSEGNAPKLQHPATYPDKLAADLVLCFSQAGDVVLDPMCGSGTTCVVAAKHNRQYLGVEINQDYCNLAKQRLQQET